MTETHYAALIRDGSEWRQFAIVDADTAVEMITQSENPERLRFVPMRGEAMIPAAAIVGTVDADGNVTPLP